LKIELLVDSGVFWPRLESDLAAARERVFVQTMSFEGDSAGRALAGALLASGARDRRVVVDEFTRHVINDKFLCHPLHLLDRELRREARDTTRMLVELLEAGVGVRFTNKAGWFYLQFPMRNHKKLVTLDGGVAYVGGINFSEHNFHWHDLMLRIEDPELTRFIEQDFECTWRGVHQEVTRRFDGLDFRILSGRTNERQFDVVLDLIARAEREIFVESPYLTPPFSEALREASLRGVRVVVVTAEKNNWRLCHDHIHWKAHAAPIEVRLYPDRMTHMKAMLLDDRHLVLGSANFELWSYRFQQEYVCIFTDPGVIAQFRQKVVHPDLARSRPTDRRIGRLKGMLADLRLEWLERLALGVNGRRFKPAAGRARSSADEARGS
jgi:cardiolipin synthase